MDLQEETFMWTSCSVAIQMELSEDAMDLITERHVKIMEHPAHFIHIPSNEQFGQKLDTIIN